MHLHLRTIGKVKDSSIANLVAEYQKRCPWKITIAEHELKKNIEGETRKKQEGAWLLSEVAKGSVILALDEKGKQFTSTQFAKEIQKWRESHGAVTFLIGGADGLSDEVKKSAHQLLSLGSMTMPHQLARIILVEQLYRASTILSGHPYHRE